MERGQSSLSTFGRGESGDSEGRRPTEAEAAEVAGDGGLAADVVDTSDYRYPDPEGSVEIAVTQVDYTVEGSGRSEHPVLHVFGRTSENDVEHVRVREFEPYFYAPLNSFDGPGLDAEPVTVEDFADDRLQNDRLRGLETESDGETVVLYEGIRGERLVKVLGQTPRDVGQLRDRFDHYEADILFPNRLLIDKDIRSGIRVPERRADDGAIDVPHQEIAEAEVAAHLRVNTFDIEVDDRQGFPEEGEEPILCLTSHDNYRDEYVVWLYEAPDGASGPDDLDGYDPIEEGSTVDVRRFESEEGMLGAFVDYVAETDPDVLTGWNFTDFDAPYLIDRLEVLGGEGALDPDRLSRVDEVWRSDWQGPNVKGRIVFDLLYAYKRTQFSELDSYRLDAVGEVELGVGKERYPGDIGDLWEDDPERLLEYNLRDVELCVELDRKQDIIAFWEEVASFVGCKLEDATTPGDAVDMYVLHKAHGKFALPSKGRQEAEEFEGGAVFEPITGVKEMVSVLDLKSLYPMCMVTINASPETKVDPEAYDGETFRAPNGQHFQREPDGIIREMVTELLDEREEKKSLRDDHAPGSGEYETFDRQQAAVKVIMNSLYGVSGWDRFRLYDKENAAAVTATGREVINYTEESVNDLGHDVAYGDSVTGDRPVVVRDPGGMVRIVPIAELFDRGTPTERSGLLITADGGPVGSASPGKDRRTLDGWEALSVDENGESEWKPIEQAVRHETDDPVVTLQHKVGESTTTRDHSYVVSGDDGLVEAKPEDVDEPLRVPDLPEVDPVEEVDVYEVLNGYSREYEDGRSVGVQFAETKTKRVHADDEYVWFGHEHHRNLDKTVRVKRYIERGTPEFEALLRLLAAYVTEGSASTIETTESRFGASIAESSRDWLGGLQEDYRRLFDNVETSIVTSDCRGERTVEYETDGGEGTVTYDDRTRKLQMMNELSAVFFKQFAGQTSRGKRIPSFVFHLSETEQQVFIDTLVEGDGSRTFPRYTEEYAERNFDYETTSRELAAGLSMLLTQRGRKHSLKYRDSKESYTVRTCEFYRAGRDPVLTEVDHDDYVYDLSVAENQNFVDAVGGIVLHNTDSIMLELGGDVSKEEAIEQSFEIEEAVNDSYDDFAREELDAEDHRFQIEFEKLYRRFFQAGKKKRYAGHIIWKEGKDVDDIDITGFEYKRSDIAPITKEVQQHVLELIVTGEGEAYREDAKEYVHGVIERFRDGEMSVEDVGIPGGIGKRLDNYDTDTAHVRGAKYANRLLGTNFQRGSKPKRLYLESVHNDFYDRVEREFDIDARSDPVYREFRENEDVICIEFADQLPPEFEVDWETMLDKTLKGPIERVLDAIGVSWDEVQSGQTQTGLGSFM
jgi:DNA polymerase I